VCSKWPKTNPWILARHALSVSAAGVPRHADRLHVHQTGTAGERRGGTTFAFCHPTT
jgi:hypothetical protein